MSGLADTQYPIKINGGGFMLIEESYRKKAQQPFSPRFATGDPTEGDNSFWQFLSQKGWTGEGQQKFDVVSKYRQSAGWDTRDGRRAYVGRGIEAVSLSSVLPAVSNPATFAIFDDFESGSINLTRWNFNCSAGAYPPNVGVDNGSNRAYGGTNSPGSGIDPTNARGPIAGDASYGAPIGVDDVGIADIGTWQFEITVNVNSNIVTHGVFFYGGVTGGYIFQASGAGGTAWKIIKTPNFPTGPAGAPNGGNAWVGNDNDTVLATYVAGTCFNVAKTVKITRDVLGNFEVFEDGASLGTFNDLTYTSTRYFCFAGAGGGRFGYGRIDNVYFPSISASNAGVSSKFINYYNALYTPWDSGGTAFAFTTVRTASQASNLPRIVHQNARDICVWQRDGSPTANLNTYLAAVGGNTLRVYNGETQVFTGSTTLAGTCVIALNSTTLIVLGVTSAGNGVPGIEIIKWDAETWTIATQVVLQLDGATSGSVAGNAALDSNGALYFATVDLSANLGCIPSRLFYATATDLLATRPTLTTSWTLTDFICRGIFSLLGTIHLYGARRRGTNSYASIVKVDGTVVYESSKAINLSDISARGKFYNHGVASIWKNLDHILFLGMTDLDLWSPVLQLDGSSSVRESASFASGQFDYTLPNINAIAEWGGAFYCLNAQAGTIKRTTVTRGGLGNSFSTCVLQLSEMGSNTSLISKTLGSVMVEISEAIPEDETMSVYVNDVLVGTIVNSDGVRKEIKLTAELTDSKFTTKVSVLQESTWQGYVPSGGIMLKYVPTQFKKKAWAVGIRCTKGLKLIDGKHEQQTPAQILAALWTAWASNIPVTFVDKDGVTYQVLITDIDERVPLMPQDILDLEALVFLELLEV